MRKVVVTDRAIYDKAQRGFVSSIRAYSKHTASSIFRVADLQWDQLGNAWGLLRLPSMPELKKWEGDRKLGLDIDFDKYAYKDKAREKQRLEELDRETPKETKVKKSLKDKRSPAWSQKLDQQATKELRRQKKQAKREHDRRAKMTEEERQKEEELQAMIAKVRQQTAVAEDDEFEGFSD
jgi:ATP-dependent RNA helicase DDX55/SPB4